MKAIPSRVPAIDLRPVLAVATTAAAAVIWTATSPRFLHPINPAPPSMFLVCMYVALAGLAVIRTEGAPGLRAATWTPVIAHLYLIAFASYSFLRYGHWPWYSFPDPKELGTPLLYGIAVISVLAGALSLPLGAVIWIACAWGSRTRSQWVTLLHAAAVLALGSWLWIFEGRDRRLFDWLAD
jgi:hypothetical protein